MVIKFYIDDVDDVVEEDIIFYNEIELYMILN